MKENIIEMILHLKTTSILLIEERARKDILIGAPHHAIGGVKELPCIEHHNSDENSGLIARQIAETLKLCSIIACNYRIDPNKNLRTDYSLQIAQWMPKFLIEIHGHGLKSISDNLIEVSAGNLTRNDYSILFASILQNKFSNNEKLKKYIAIGDFNKLHFKGTKSATIIDDRWVPFHIELPPSLRINPSDNALPSSSEDLVKALIETIEEVCK